VTKLKGLSGWLSPRSPKVTREWDEVTLVYDHRSGDTAITNGFLGVCLTVWTLGCCLMTSQVLFGKDKFHLLFLTPFYVAELGMLAFFLTNLTHYEFVRLDRSGFRYWRSIVLRFRSRHIPIDELESFTVTAQTLDHAGNPVNAIRAEGIGVPFPFFDTVSAEDAREATQELNSVLAVLRPTFPATSPRATPRPPAGSVWRQTNEGDFVRLDRSSQATFGFELASKLFVALFWNSFVGVFTSLEVGLLWFPQNPPIGNTWWILFFWLIPFQVVGAVFMSLLVSAIYEWLVHESWRLYRRRLVLSKSLLGIPVGTKAYESIDCVRLDCSPEVEEQKPSIEVNAAEKPKTQTWKLAFVQRDETPLVEWKGLSFGEARWLRSTVLLERRNWFRETG
jgi:hypothetical protein